MSLEHAPHRARRFRRKEACDYLSDEHGVCRSPRTLAKLAVLGGGPVMIYEGRFPTYTPAALDDYAKAILSAPVHNRLSADGCSRRRTPRDPWPAKAGGNSRPQARRASPQLTRRASSSRLRIARNLALLKTLSPRPPCRDRPSSFRS